VTDASFDLSGGAPATYTSIFRGCHWGNCTSNNPFPIQESNIATASTAVTIIQPGGYANDSAYDIWFNTTPTTSGQPNGTEIMIWINHQGGVTPFGSQVGTVNIDGIEWNVYDGRQTSWNCISYEAQNGVTTASLNLLPYV
jgi:cellulose 1,4-beta-cellobiosidase